MLNGLRLNAGMELALLTQRSGLDLEWFQKGIDAGQRRGLLLQDRDRVMASDTGRRFLNDLLELFLPEENSSGPSSASAAPIHPKL